jgi:phosphoribosylformylglycinamidine cyclo-ligase
MSQHYQDAGVSLDAGYESVRRIKAHTERTRNLGMMGSIGAFGGLFDLAPYAVKDPVLVSGTDGVGTKLKLAMLANTHDTVGIDCVAMCVNDVLAQGAKPLFFLDYLAMGRLDPLRVEALVKGVADGCVQAGCALIGGETAEMPDFYPDGDYDIAGFCVGIAERTKLQSPQNVHAGDAVIGLASSGLHSNGYSLVRKILFKDHKHTLEEPFGETTLGEVLLKPTTIYVKPVLDVLDRVAVHGIAHITGGGFYENMPRCIQATQGLRITQGSWPIPPIIDLLRQEGELSIDELYHVFNMGIGMILIVDPAHVTETLSILHAHHQAAYRIGEVTSTPGLVIA